MSPIHHFRLWAGITLCCFVFLGEARAQSPFIRADVNCDGKIDNLDIQAINNYLFGGFTLQCDDAADVNDDGQINIVDANQLQSFINTGAPVPPQPYPNCGYDPTLDALTCSSTCCGAARDHFQVWRLSAPPFTGTALVRDQFMTDQMTFTRIEFLANPARKDTFNIIHPDDHLTWYSASGRDTLLTVEFANQFGIDTVQIGSPSHLILPTQKLPHPPPSPTLDHYKAYRIINPQPFVRVTTLFDQFNPNPWTLDQLTPLYFLTPASKNNEPMHDSVVHYVAYEFIPKNTQGTVRQTVDQFGNHTLQVLNSDMLMVPTYKIRVQHPTPNDSLKNHYKSWRINPPTPFSGFAVTQDQFMTNQLFLGAIEFLSNPAVKDTSGIRRPNDHLNWYRAQGQPTNLFVVFKNQFNQDTILIDSVTHLLVPCRKDPHPAPDSLLGHYTSYRIRKGKTYIRPGGPVTVQDQFDQVPEHLDSLVPRYFLTPARKNNEPAYGPDTHYVAYEIFPKTQLPTVMSRLTDDQFGTHQHQIFRSELLLVPSNKITWGPPPVDTLKNHYKGWRLESIPWLATVTVQDQFMTDIMRLDTIKYLANPAQKNNEPIVRPDDHLLWYGAKGKNTCLRIIYDNQFGRDTFVIGTAAALLVPAQKLPHNAPDPTKIDHYKAYLVRNPQQFTLVTQIQDQFDPLPETVDILKPLYFLTPANKNGEGINDTVTHYVAYEITPKDPMVNSRVVIDQFGTHQVVTRNSELLFVPTHKLQVNPYCILTLPGNVNCDAVVTSSDIIYLVNYVFKGGVAPCPCAAAGDMDCNGLVNSADIIKLVNYVFKGGPPPCDVCTVIPTLWICPC